MFFIISAVINIADDIDALVRALSLVIKKSDSEQNAVDVLPEFSGSYL
ncbi:hypothetical protein HOD84_01145 [bacterium]|jgi:hypothetical protein|nr:hypothetical protein [bacterium]